MGKQQATAPASEEDEFEILTQGVNITPQERLTNLSRAVERSPECRANILGTNVDCLIDSGSMVSLIRTSHYERYVRPRINEGRFEGIARYFRLSGASGTIMPVQSYCELDVEVQGIVIKGVPFLVTPDPANVSKNKKPKAGRLPVTIGWNAIRLAKEQFVEQYGMMPLENWDKPTNYPKFMFAQILSYHHQPEMESNLSSAVFTERVETTEPGITADHHGLFQPDRSQSAKGPVETDKDNETTNKEPVCRVFVGDQHKPVYIPAGSSLTVVGKTDKPCKGDLLLEGTKKSNLPNGLVLNMTLVSPKRRKVSVILMNPTERNIRIPSRVCAGELFRVDCIDWDWEVELKMKDETQEEEGLEVSFRQVPSQAVQEELLRTSSSPQPEVILTSNEAEAGVEPEEPESEDSTFLKKPREGLTATPDDKELPKFKEKPNTDTPDFNFKKEIEELPFKFNLGEVELTVEQQKRLINMIYDNKESFSLHDGDLGNCDILKHTIPTIDKKPVYLSHRMIPPNLVQEVKDILNTWVKQGIIRPSRSPYASQVVLVRKKTGELRVCVDYRKLNSVTIRDAFPLPRIEEALQAVRDCKWFTSIDLAQGYLQMQMAEEDMHKTAFRAGSSGLFEFTRMPFGLCNAVSSFCRLMELCLGDQQFVTLLLYLDDICIFAKDEDVMLDRIELVLQRLKQFHLKIKPKKSFFFQKRVLFLGYELSEEGVRPNPSKVAKVAEWPAPKNRAELQSFIGLASYYRRFVDKFAKIAKPLHDLIGPTANVSKRKKKTLKELPPFEWKEEHQQAFEKLKLALTSAPLLAFPDFKLPFVLETDASELGLGAVLSQVQDGKKKVIAYASRSLRPPETKSHNYSSAKLELLALKWAVTEKLRDYLLGAKFTVYTDNSPLAYVKTAKLGSACMRWLSDLALFDFDIKYRSGKTNLAADALSRRPYAPDEKDPDLEEANDSDDEQVLNEVQASLPNRKEVRKARKEVLNELRHMESVRASEPTDNVQSQTPIESTLNPPVSILDTPETESVVLTSTDAIPTVTIPVTPAINSVDDHNYNPNWCDCCQNPKWAGLPHESCTGYVYGVDPVTQSNVPIQEYFWQFTARSLTREESQAVSARQVTSMEGTVDQVNPDPLEEYKDYTGFHSSESIEEFVSQLYAKQSLIPKTLKQKITALDRVALETACETSNINSVTDLLDASEGMIFNPYSPEEMRALQKEDKEISPFLESFEKGLKPSSRKIFQNYTNKQVRRLFFDWNRYTLIKGVLHRFAEYDGIEYTQLVLPETLRKAVLQSLHDEMAHQRLEKTTELLQRRVYWPTMLKDVAKYMQNCHRCNTAKGSYTEPKPEQGSLRAKRPMELLCIDFTTLDPSSSGKENVLVVTDAFTKFAQAWVTPNQTAKTVAKMLVDKWFLVYGIPERIHSDQGKSFINAVIKHLLAMFGIKQSKTTPYNPRGNSITERFNRTLHNLLQTLPPEDKTHWPDHLPYVTLQYNCTPHKTTRIPPYELFFGREASTPCDNWLGLHQYAEEFEACPTTWLNRQKELLIAANRRALKNIEKMIVETKFRKNAKDLNIPVGNLVLERAHPTGPKKIKDRYKPDIFKVVENIGLEKTPEDPDFANYNVYKIQPLEGGPTRNVNRRQLLDLGSEYEILKPSSEVPHYTPRVRVDNTPPAANTRAKRRQKAANTNSDDSASESDENEF